MEADRQRAEADRQQMRAMFEWMQMVGQSLGQPPPAFLSPPPPPADRSYVSMIVLFYMHLGNFLDLG